MYMYQSRSFLDRAHHMVSILALHHQHSFVLFSSSHVTSSFEIVE
jgi:hypothetical protein